MNKRALSQYLVLPIFFIVIALGWKFPLFGLIVPIVMLVGIVGALKNGRYVCGHLCPRGAFYDRVLSRVSPRKKIPSLLRNMKFRLAVLVLLMGMMLFRLLSIHWSYHGVGLIFWQICFFTSLIGVILGLFFHQRSWCAFCPIGTLGQLLGRGRSVITLEQERCVGCRRCENVCPAQLSLVPKIDGWSSIQVKNSDCLKCGECIAACPKKALHFEKLSISE